MLAPRDLRELLQSVQRRPGMYVREVDPLGELETMCHGYSTALNAHGIKEFGADFNSRFCQFL